MEVELQMQLALSHIHLSTPMMSSGGGVKRDVAVDIVRFCMLLVIAIPSGQEIYA